MKTTTTSRLDVYRDMIEHAPAEGLRAPDGLLGWADDLGYCLCSHCAGRITARGCNLSRMTAIWDNSDEDCDLCGKALS